ncbi:MAG TPA: hypothetical protein VJR58_29440, partial [Vineibacter sp.]|nr:hypothetical protein [Vineibacter sp.]
MLGKIAALVLALTIGFGAGMEARAQTKTPAKHTKPVHKTAPKSTSGAHGATARPNPVRKKPSTQS